MDFDDGLPTSGSFEEPNLLLLTDGSGYLDGIVLGQGESRRCNCKKAKCLKLYCVCFAGGMYCTGCPCRECQNTLAYSDVVQAERQKILERSPNAFAPKIEAKGDGDVTHKKGCRCRKSRCLKKYCECFDACVPCSYNCRCDDCHNQPEGGFVMQLSLPAALGAIHAGSTNVISDGQHTLAPINQDAVAMPAAPEVPMFDKGSGKERNDAKVLDLVGERRDGAFSGQPAQGRDQGLLGRHSGDYGQLHGGVTSNLGRAQLGFSAVHGFHLLSDVAAQRNHDQGRQQIPQQPSFAPLFKPPAPSPATGNPVDPGPGSLSCEQGRNDKAVKTAAEMSKPAEQRQDDACKPQAATPGIFANLLFLDLASMQLDPSMLQPSVLIQEPQAAARLAAVLSLDEAHQTAAQKSAQILKTLIQLGHDSALFHQPLSQQQQQQQPTTGDVRQTEQLSEQLMKLPLSAVLDTCGTQPFCTQNSVALPDSSMWSGLKGLSGFTGGTGLGRVMSPGVSFEDVSGGRANRRLGAAEGVQRHRTSNDGPMKLGAGAFRFEGVAPALRGSAGSAAHSGGYGGDGGLCTASKRRSDSGTGEAMSVARSGKGAPQTAPTGLVSYDSAYEVDQCVVEHLASPAGTAGGRAHSLPPPALPRIDSEEVPHFSDSILHHSASQPFPASLQGEQTSSDRAKRQCLASRSSDATLRDRRPVRVAAKKAGPSKEAEVFRLDSQNEIDALQALFDLSTGP